MRRLSTLALVALLALGLVATTGCIRRTPRTLPETKRVENASVPLGGEAVEVTLKMGAGELTVAGEDIAPDALRGRFVYTPARLKPQVESSTEGSATQVTVSNPESVELTLKDVSMRNEWAISLPTSTPVSLTTMLGAGEATLDLRDVALDYLAIEQGAGDITVDLSAQDRDLMGQATLGAGTVTIKVPAKVGVRLRGNQDGLGDWSDPGYTKKGGALVNAAYGTPGVPTIDLDVQRGLGDVRIVEVP